MKRRIVCLLLALLLLAAVLPLPTASAERAQVMLTDLRAKFPSGTYWNHPGGYNSPNSYTYSPCGHAHGAAITTAAAAAIPSAVRFSASDMPTS